MFNRKRLNRERLEIYLVHLLLAYRPWLWITGILLLVYALATMINSLLTGIVVALIAAFPLLLATSYPAVVLVARLGAWIGTLWRKD